MNNYQYLELEAIKEYGIANNLKARVDIFDVLKEQSAQELLDNE